MLKDSSEAEPAISEVFDPTVGKVEKPSVKRKVPWNPWSAVVYAVLVYFLAQIIAGAIVQIYPRVEGWSSIESSNWLNNSAVAQFWYVLFAEALTFGAIWWFVRLRKAGLGSIGWQSSN